MATKECEMGCGHARAPHSLKQFGKKKKGRQRKTL
jgi:hypothetical protein